MVYSSLGDRYMESLIINNTPVETYSVRDRTVYVKREDLSSFPPGPPFSKVRGLVPALLRLQRSGTTAVGYTETAVSMAGWGVAWACSHLGMKAVIFDPQYKKTPPLLAYHRKQWTKFGPDIIPIPAGRAKVGFYQSQKILKEKYPGAKMLPLGLVFPETIEAVRVEASLPETADLLASGGTLVVNIGSGTIAAGLVRAFKSYPITIIGVMGRSGSIELKHQDIRNKALVVRGLLHCRFKVVDPGWEYTQRSSTQCPFPSHPWYDLKAWQWLVENIDELKDPILFWNIGRVK